MMKVWVDACHPVMGEALARLLAQEGFDPRCRAEDADVGLRFVAEAGATPSRPPTALPTLAIVPHADELRLVDLLRVGYAGVHLPGDAPERLPEALRSVAAGESWAEPSLLERAREPDPAPRLTARETEVLSLLARGLPNKSIARRLSIAEKTVKIHVSSILHKHRAKNRVDLLTRRDFGRYHA